MGQADNAATIATLRGRVSRAKKWRLFFLLLMPLGFILPCSLSIALSPAKGQPPPQGITPPQILGMFALGLPIIGFGGWILMHGDKSGYARALAIAEQADATGLQFSGMPLPGLLASVEQFRMFANATKQGGQNCCTGEIAGRRVAFFDQAVMYPGSMGPGNVIKAQSVVVVFDLAPQVPDFQVTPKGWLDKIAEVFGASIIELPDQEEFNKRFTLWGEAVTEIKALTSPKAVDLLGKANATVEVYRGNMVFYRHHQLAEPRLFVDMIKQAIEIAKALE